MLVSPPLAIPLIALAVIWIEYRIIFPSQRDLTPKNAAMIDAFAIIAVTLIVGLLYDDQGLRFSLILFETNWFVYALILSLLIETPFAIRLWKERGW